MRLRLTSKQGIHAAAVAAACLVAASLGISRESAIAPAVIPATPARAPGDAPSKAQGSAADFDLALLSRSGTQEIEEHLFSVPQPPTPPSTQTATMKAAPAPQQVPPPAPTAPTLPFRFLGRLIDGGATTAFVAYGNQNLSLKEGDVIENLYRVETIAETQLVFVYLPLQEKQTLPLGARP